MPLFELRVAEEIPSGGRVADEITPASGKEVVVKDFRGSGGYVPNAYTAVVWKYQHATEAEVIIWSTKGDTKMPFIYTIDGSLVDGVRKLAVLCENSESGPLVLSAYALVTVRD